jgi:DNA-binding response OmpR family regulator
LARRRLHDCLLKLIRSTPVAHTAWTQARARRPALPVLFVTGFADRRALAGVSENHIINKPFVDDELARKVRLVLTRRDSDKVVRLRR